MLTHVEQLAEHWERENWILPPPPEYFVRELRDAINRDKRDAKEEPSNA